MDRGGEHRKVYRVRRIPSSWSIIELRTNLLAALNINDSSSLHIRSYASDFTRHKGLLTRTAVVSFDIPPNRAKKSRFSIIVSEVKLHCDSVFDGFTPLSSIDTDKHHDAE
jgi:hypothetical protein